MLLNVIEKYVFECLNRYNIQLNGCILMSGKREINILNYLK